MRGTAVLAMATSSIIWVAAAAQAQPRGENQPTRRDLFFVEAAGGYGFQVGDTEYLPNGALDRYKHPVVHGWNLGGTIGVLVSSQVAIIGNYEFTDARTREGEVPLVIDEVQGEIDYHTLVAGVRIYVPVGFGRFRAELAAGLVFPFDEKVTIDYGPQLEQVGITGRGRRAASFDLGYGAHGAFGYELPIWGPLYGLANLKTKAFQAENGGETTRFDNFVTDFGETPPTAVDAVIRNGDGSARPRTEAVSEIRFQLGVGARF